MIALETLSVIFIYLFRMGLLGTKVKHECSQTTHQAYKLGNILFLKHEYKEANFIKKMCAVLEKHTLGIDILAVLGGSSEAFFAILRHM